jgi:hypothetical protein
MPYVRMDATVSSDFSLSLTEAAQQLPISNSLMYDLVRKGLVPSIRIKKKFFVRPADIARIKVHGLPTATPVIQQKVKS